MFCRCLDYVSELLSEKNDFKFFNWLTVDDSSLEICKISTEGFFKQKFFDKVKNSKET